MDEAVISFCKGEQQGKEDGNSTGLSSSSSPTSKASSQSSAPASQASTPPSYANHDNSHSITPGKSPDLILWPAKKAKGKRVCATTESQADMASIVTIYNLSHKGTGKGGVKKPKTCQDLHDYRITKVGACPKHRRGKHKVC